MITKITYNWHQVNDGNESGEDFYTAEVGKEIYKEKLVVKEITEHCAAGEGDKWYYDITFIDDTQMRVFNPNLVYRTKDDNGSGF